MIAYVILAHKNLDQVVRLVGRLEGPRSRFVIHVDAASELTDGVVKLGERDDVELAERFRCPWARFGIVDATLAALPQALADPAVRRITLMTGQDYPIAPRARIEAFLLDEHPDESFIEHFPLPRTDWAGGGGIERIEDWYVGFLGKKPRSLRNSRVGLRRSLPYALEPYQGGASWSMTRELAELVVEYVRTHPRVTRFYRHSFAPDESFFQTIAMSSPLAPRVVNDDLRFEKWGEDSDHPEILTVGDLPELMRSDALFAKKFDATVDAEVMDRIDAELLVRAS
ncbi:MAG: beta-1,6-N-acetylglucosaminyltransferase [Thermoleophilaceae bacterium]